MSCSVFAPVTMEDQFSPGFRAYPAVHVGSQTMGPYWRSPESQAWESIQLAAAAAGDVVVVRQSEPSYLAYWQELAGPIDIVELEGAASGEFLTQALLNDNRAVAAIADRARPRSVLAVFFPTELEADLARRVGIPLHGAPHLSAAYGTKSGVRELARRAGLAMPPGFVCRNVAEARQAMAQLSPDFEEVIVKHDLATGGLWSSRWHSRRSDGLPELLDRLAAGSFIEGRDVVVVEGWLKSAAALCAHIELLPGHEPIICAGWQQVMDKDGTTHVGSGPLRISAAAVASFRRQAEALAGCLHEQGAVGSYGPDFLVTADGETRAGSDPVVLLELNARAPTTAYALEIVKRVRGRIGAGFYSSHVSVPRPMTFVEVAARLESAGLLLRRSTSRSRGVVPYNVGLLPWRAFDAVALADSWEEALSLMAQVKGTFGR